MGTWRFFLDENIGPKTATYLQKEGVNAEHVRDALWQDDDDEDDVLIEEITSLLTFERGDAIATGTPASVGPLSGEAPCRLRSKVSDNLNTIFVASEYSDDVEHDFVPIYRVLPLSEG